MRGGAVNSQNNSLMAVFEAVADAGELNRAKISDVTGFSLVTVGKAVDLLSDCGVVTQYKHTSGTAGRKSGVCKLVKSNGMLIFDLTQKPTAGLYDISLAALEEYTGDDVADMMAHGLMRFGEVLGGELMGIGCVAGNGEAERCIAEISDVIGASPEIIISSDRAYAVANARRFDFSGMAVFIRLLAEGCTDGAIMYGDRLYTGAHGDAGKISDFIPSREMLALKLNELCHILDPELIHISCETEAEYKAVEDELKAAIIGETAPRIIIEPAASCRSALNGAAILLREKYLLSKLPNNT